jgi:hypothetical protein
VDTYSLPAYAWPPRQPKTLFNFLLSFASYDLIFFAIELVWNHFSPRDSVKGLAFKALFWSFGVSLWNHLRKENDPPDYSLVIDDEAISMKLLRSGKAIYRQRVGREEIRTIVERAKGLMISEHGRVGAFFLGGVWVRKQLADYEYVKRFGNELERDR